MPDYIVTDPDTGVKLKITGDSPPTEAELNEIFSDISAAASPQKGSPSPQEPPSSPQGGQNPFVEKIDNAIMGTVEGLLNIGSTVVGSGVSKTVGMMKDVLDPRPPVQENTPESVARAKESVDFMQGLQESMTYQPRTEAGRSAVETVGKVLQPVGEFFGKIEKGLGNIVLKKTGSPTLAGLAAISPTMAMEALGFAGGKAMKARSLNKQIARSLDEAIPDAESIKKVSRGIYKEIDGANITLKPGAFQEMYRGLRKQVQEFATLPALTPKSHAILEEVKKWVESGRAVKITDVDNFRRMLRKATNVADGSDHALALDLIDSIDDFLDGAGPSMMNNVGKPGQVGSAYRAARRLWRRAKKAEIIDEMLRQADLDASRTSFEVAINNQFRRLAKNPRKFKQFSKAERDMIEQIVKGTQGSNIAKALGKLGYGANRVFSPTVGAGLGSHLFGPSGAVVVPVIGTIGKKLADRMILGRANFLQKTILAGRNARKIAKVYLQNTPKGLRKPEELAQLLLRPNVDLATLPKQFPFIEKAADLAQETRAAISATALEQGSQDVVAEGAKTIARDRAIKEARAQETARLKQEREQRKATEVPPPKAKRTPKPLQLNVQKDSIQDAIAKLGGLDAEEVKRMFGIESKELNKNMRFVGKPVVRRKKGHSLDEMAEKLADEGYLGRDESGKADIRELEERFFEDEAGNKQYSRFREQDVDDINKEFEQFFEDQNLP